jgi:hypothetical protein
VVDKKRIIRKNGGPRRWKGTRGRWPKKRVLTRWTAELTSRGLGNGFPDTDFRSDWMPSPYIGGRNRRCGISDEPHSGWSRLLQEPSADLHTFTLNDCLLKY